MNCLVVALVFHQLSMSPGAIMELATQSLLVSFVKRRQQSDHNKYLLTLSCKDNEIMFIQYFEAANVLT